MMNVLVRITGQLSTAIRPVVGSISSVIVPCNLGEESLSPGSLFDRPSLFGVGLDRAAEAQEVLPAQSADSCCFRRRPAVRPVPGPHRRWPPYCSLPARFR